MWWLLAILNLQVDRPIAIGWSVPFISDLQTNLVDLWRISHGNKRKRIHLPKIERFILSEIHLHLPHQKNMIWVSTTLSNQHVVFTWIYEIYFPKAEHLALEKWWEGNNYMFRLVRVLGLCWWFFGRICFAVHAQRSMKRKKMQDLQEKTGRTDMFSHRSSISFEWFFLPFRCAFFRVLFASESLRCHPAWK